MSYDPRCYDLATVFLASDPERNTETNRTLLAQSIQTAIEETIEWGLSPAFERGK